MADPLSAPDYARFSRGRRLRAIRRNAAGLLFRLLLAPGRWLPVPVAQGMGRAFGRFAYFAAPRLRAMCLAHLALAFPEMLEAGRQRLAKQCFAHVGMTIFEFLAMPRLRRDPARWVRLEGGEALLAAHEQGKGVLLVAGHVGNWELWAQALEPLGLPVRAVIREMADPLFNRVLMAHRETTHFKVIRQDSAASGRDLLRCLRRGQVLQTFVDLDTHVQSVFVDYFGVAANTPRAPAMLALRYGLPVVLGHGRRLADGTHRFTLEPFPVPPALTDDEAGVRDLTQRFTARLEAIIREEPAQWMWLFRRWRRRPAEEPA